MLLAAWESEQELMEKKEKEVSSLAKVGLVGRQAHQWGGCLTCTRCAGRVHVLQSAFWL